MCSRRVLRGICYEPTYRARQKNVRRYLTDLGVRRHVLRPNDRWRLEGVEGLLGGRRVRQHLRRAKGVEYFRSTRQATYTATPESER